MVNLRRLTERAKKVVEKRGGVGSLKEDAEELRDVARGEGSLKDKAKAAGKAIKDPGEKGPEREKKNAPGARPEADRPGTRSK
jgi:hypothetical protein